MTRDFVLLGLFLIAYFFIGLGAHPYGVPSEARYIEIPMQMVHTGDWVTPRLNGVKYFEKPPLFYWIQAAQFELFGDGEFSGRLWTAIFMAGFSLLTGIGAARLFGRWTGILSALVMASCVLGYASSRIVLLDVPVSFFLTATLFAFLFAIDAPKGRKRDLLLLLMYVSAALATLTKGLIGIVIPGMIIGLWIVLTGRWKLLKEVRLIPGLIVFLIIAAPWHILAGVHTPEFYRFYFVHEHFERFLTKIHGRYEPPWFFFAVILLGLLPWTAFLFQGFAAKIKPAWRDRFREGTDLYLFLWLVLPLIFFSLSDSKLISYILPVFPVAAMMIARYLCRIVETGETRGFRIGVYGYALFFLAFAIAFPVAYFMGGKAGRVVAPVTGELTAFAILMTLQALLLAALLWRKAAPVTIVKALTVTAILFSASACYIAPQASTRSSRDTAKPFAEFLKPRLRPGDEVISFAHYYQDLPIYLDRNVTVVDAFGEMTFGRDIEPATHQWMIHNGEFEKRWEAGGHRIYVLLRKHEFRPDRFPDAHIIYDDGGPNLLISNEGADQ